MEGHLAKMIVQVPASTANLGSGFDSIGVAFQLYLHIEVEPSDHLHFDWKGNLADQTIEDEDNLILHGLQKVFEVQGKEIPALHLSVQSDIPLTRGLGSSASAYVAGLVIANKYLGKRLTDKELLWLATEKEGHPDNVGASIFGGVFFASVDWKKKQVVHHNQPFPEEWQFVAAIPSYTLSTAKARQILPQDYAKADSIFNVSRFGMLVSSLFTKDKEAMIMGLEDALHQPYRSHLIPGFQELQAEKEELGVLGFVISGAGPTVLAIIDKDTNEEQLIKKMKEHMTVDNHDVEVKRVTVDNMGYTVKNILYNRSGSLD